MQRPKDFIEPPLFVITLVEQCWDGDPFKRPKIDEIAATFEYESNLITGIRESYIINDDEQQHSHKHDDNIHNKQLQKNHTTKKDKNQLLENKTQPLETIKSFNRLSSSSIILNEVRDFLTEIELNDYFPVIVDKGFGDMESLCDREVLDDETLRNDIKMNKSDIRKFRSAIESKGLSTTMVKARKNMSAMTKDGKEEEGGGMEGAFEVLNNDENDDIKKPDESNMYQKALDDGGTNNKDDDGAWI
jgi:hypothetical protein